MPGLPISTALSPSHRASCASGFVGCGDARISDLSSCGGLGGPVGGTILGIARESPNSKLTQHCSASGARALTKLSLSALTPQTATFSLNLCAKKAGGCCCKGRAAREEAERWRVDQMADDPTAEDFPLLTPMLVMRFDKFKAQGHIPRSNEAEAKELLEKFDAAASDQITVFISHQWWQSHHPDYTEGVNAHLKFRTVIHGVEQLIAKFGLDQRQVYICK